MFLRKRALERIASEKVLFERHRGGDIRLCVVYPNVYRLGMANLGFQAVYHIFESDPRVAADRAFLPDPDERAYIRARGERLVSFERGEPLGGFDVIAFSISFETDYLNLITMLRMAGIPLHARRARRPQLSADHRRRLGGVPQSRADRRFRRSLSDRRGRGDGARIHRALSRDRRSRWL